MKKFIATNILFFTVFLMAPSCDTTKAKFEASEEKQTMTGKIDVAGMSTYMYGTHKFYTEDTFYAIRSEKYKLDDYMGKTVTIVYEKIEGYPVESGPEYLKILEIRE